MPEDYEQLQKKIEDGLAAARELKRLTAEKQRRERPRLRLIKGGMVWGAIAAGVEWCRDYRRTAAALAFSSLTVGGVVIAEHPGSPGADPPRQTIVTPKPRTSVPPKPPRVVPTPSPRRTSPPRTPARITPPAVAAKTPGRSRPHPQVTPSPEATKPSTVSTSVVSLPVAPTIAPSLPVVVESASCTINLLGVKVCLPGG